MRHRDRGTAEGAGRRAYQRAEPRRLHLLRQRHAPRNDRRGREGLPVLCHRAESHRRADSGTDAGEGHARHPAGGVPGGERPHPRMAPVCRRGKGRKRHPGEDYLQEYREVQLCLRRDGRHRGGGAEQAGHAACGPGKERAPVHLQRHPAGFQPVRQLFPGHGHPEGGPGDAGAETALPVLVLDPGAGEDRGDCDSRYLPAAGARLRIPVQRRGRESDYLHRGRPARRSWRRRTRPAWS